MSNKYEVWYSKDFWASCQGDQVIAAATIADTHVKVKDIEAPNPDSAFCAMQGEVWSPNGEARSLIKRLGLKHTSMSVGDVLHALSNNIWLRVRPFGWEKV